MDVALVAAGYLLTAVLVGGYAWWTGRSRRAR